MHYRWFTCLPLPMNPFYKMLPQPLPSALRSTMCEEWFHLPPPFIIHIRKVEFQLFFLSAIYVLFLRVLRYCAPFLTFLYLLESAKKARVPTSAFYIPAVCSTLLLSTCQLLTADRTWCWAAAAEQLTADRTWCWAAAAEQLTEEVAADRQLAGLAHRTLKVEVQNPKKILSFYCHVFVLISFPSRREGKRSSLLFECLGIEEG